MFFSFKPLIHGLSTFSVLITLYSFDTYMEWKYDRESREFLMSLGGAVSIMITGLILYFYLIRINYSPIAMSYNKQLKGEKK